MKKHMMIKQGLNLNTWDDIFCPGVKIQKMKNVILLKLIYTYSIIPIKILQRKKIQM